MSSANYQEYPKEMHHPQYKPASFKRESAEGLPKGIEPGTYDAKPAYLPPVTVHTKDQEEQAAAKGYVPLGEGDPEAYRRAVLGVTEPDAHVFREFPKWKYHETEEPVLVQDADQEAELGAGWADNPSGPFEEMGAAQEQGTTVHKPRAKRAPSRRASSS